MPARLAALATLWRAISSKRLSTGCAMALAVLAPAHLLFFITEVEAVLEVEQTGHQADGKRGASSITTAATRQRLAGAKQVLALEHLAGSVLNLNRVNLLSN